MTTVINKFSRGASAAWWWLRQVLGDAAYENYLRSASRRRRAQETGKDRCSPPGDPGRLLSREEFYLDALQRRYSSVSRCC